MIRLATKVTVIALVCAVLFTAYILAPVYAQPTEQQQLEILNMIEEQRNIFDDILAIGGADRTEEQYQNLIDDIKSMPPSPPDPEHEKLMKIVNDTETARSKLAFISAPPPVRYNLDEVTMAQVPYTAPNQIAIHFWAGDGNRSVVDNHKDWISLGWSGSINFAAGSKIVSYSGMGEDYFLVDCPPNTPYGVSFQKESDYGRMEVFITGSELNEVAYAPYGLITITGTCPPF